MSVKRCMDEISSAELTEWIAYDMIDPIGDERADLRAGIIASTVIRAACPKADVKPIDFMPDFDGLREKRKQKKPRQTVEEMQRQLMIAGNMMDVKQRKAKR